MAKGQKRSTKEVRKAKKVPTSTATISISSSAYKAGPGMGEAKRAPAPEVPAIRSKS